MKNIILFQNRTNHISMSVENGSPVQKIVWSSFDYMAGPELLFVWESDCSKQIMCDDSLSAAAQNADKMRLELPADFAEDDGLVDAVSSSDSSFSKVC
jgi:hypothetical protein